MRTQTSDSESKSEEYSEEFKYPLIPDWIVFHLSLSRKLSIAIAAVLISNRFLDIYPPNRFAIIPNRSIRWEESRSCNIY